MKVLQFFTLLVPIMPFASAWGAGEPLVDQFRELSGRIPFLNASWAVYSRIQVRDFPEEDARAVREAMEEFWTLARAAGEDGIEDALGDADPKVRTMGLLAAHWSEGAERWLPKVVAMAEDGTETFPKLRFRNSPSELLPPLEERTEPQTVGEIATSIARAYLSASGYHYGIAGSPPQHPGFAEYWKEREARDYCLGWFKVQLSIASEGSSSIGERQMEKIGQLRAKIDALPSPDREWILLSLASPWDGGDHMPGGRELAGEADLVAAMGRLGHERLITLLSGGQISDDPDMPPGSAAKRAFGHGRVIAFVLRHPRAAFGPEHADQLLTLGNGVGGALFSRAHWWTAAAKLAPLRAPAILSDGAERSTTGNSTEDQDDRAMIAMARWEHLGAAALPEITDWFFTDEPDGGVGFGRHRMCGFMWEEGRDELLHAILGDGRLDRLDWGTLDQIVRNGIVNRREAAPVDAEELRKARHPMGGSGGYSRQRAKAEADYPKETAELEEVLAGWREKLRAYAAPTD